LSGGRVIIVRQAAIIARRRAAEIFAPRRAAEIFAPQRAAEIFCGFGPGHDEAATELVPARPGQCGARNGVPGGQI